MTTINENCCFLMQNCYRNLLPNIYVYANVSKIVISYLVCAWNCICTMSTIIAATAQLCTEPIIWLSIRHLCSRDRSPCPPLMTVLASSSAFTRAKEMGTRQHFYERNSLLVELRFSEKRLDCVLELIYCFYTSFSLWTLSPSHVGLWRDFSLVMKSAGLNISLSPHGYKNDKIQNDLTKTIR